MATSEIEEFARILIQSVRDAAIQSSDQELHSNGASPVARRWKTSAQRDTPEDFAKLLVPDIIDDTIFFLLRAIDDGILKLSFSASNGKTVDLSTDGLGELAGWYMGSDAWRAKYAKERFVDDFRDLDRE